MKKLETFAYILGLFVVTAVFLLITAIPAESNSDIEINNYYAEITIDNDGDMTVHEEWDMDYKEKYNVRFRDIEFDKFPINYPFPNSSDNEASFNIETYSTSFLKDDVDVSENTSFGYSFLFDKDERGDYVACPDDLSYDCESFFVNAVRVGGLEGDVTFIYDYTIENVITEYSDISELNWILFEYAESIVDKGQVHITLPNDFNEYYFFHPEIDIDNVEKESNTVSFFFTHKTNRDPLAFRLLVPPTTFSSIEAKNIFIDPEVNKDIIIDYENRFIENPFIYNNSDSILFFSSLVLSIMLSFSIIVLVKKRYLKAPIITPMTNVVTPPTEHSPGIVGYLYNGEMTNPEDISATILDLIFKNYLIVNDDNIFNNNKYTIDDLVQSEKKRILLKKDPMSQYDVNLEPIDIDKNYDFEENFDVILELNKDMNINELTSYEKIVIEYYIDKFGDGEKVSLQDIKKKNEKSTSASQFISLSTNFQREVKKEAKHYDYYDKTLLFKKKRLQIIFTLIPLIFVLGLLIVYSTLHIYNLLSFVPIGLSMLYIYTSIYGIKIRSAWGEKFYTDWTSYKQNLENLHVLKTSNINDVEFWDHNLIYATVFNLAEKVLDEIEISIPSTELERTVSTTYTRRSYNRYTHYYFRRNLMSIHTKNYQTASATISRNSSSSGGYRSSGGSFGGGGGGGRSR